MSKVVIDAILVSLLFLGGVLIGRGYLESSMFHKCAAEKEIALNDVKFSCTMLDTPMQTREK